MHPPHYGGGPGRGSILNMKKTYITPETTVIELELSASLLVGSISGESGGLTPAGPGHGPGRAPRQSDWRDWENGN